jgi:transposase
MTATTRTRKPTASDAVLCVAFELGEGRWKLTMAGDGAGPVVRRTIPARDTRRLLETIEIGARRLGLEGRPVASCYEAGRDGFWLHRFLVAHGIENVVVDSASIEVNRRKRRAKSDRLDGEALLDLLQRHRAGGRRKVWSVVRVPSVEEEDQRHLHRELAAAKRDRTRVTNRMKGLLANQGISFAGMRGAPRGWESLQSGDGHALPPKLRARLARDQAQVAFLTQRIRELEAERRRHFREGRDVAGKQARRLYTLRAIGANGAWLLGSEFFAWRGFRNGKQVGSLAGLTPTPHQSGETERERGVGKDGNRHVRSVAIELAWAWRRFQPESELAQWYERRFGHGSTRLRKIGIVALARKLLIALWRFVERGVLPEGALLKTNLQLH